MRIGILSNHRYDPVEPQLPYVRPEEGNEVVFQQVKIAIHPTFLTFFERFFAELLVRTCCLTR